MCTEKPLGYLLVRDGCRSIWCRHCKSSKGHKLRKRLLERYEAKGIGRVGFATLTCSPAILGDDPEEQFRRIKADRLVARFVRFFRQVVQKKVAYLSISEFHKHSGQVHFHLALDGCGKLSKEALAAVQQWCQEHMGTFDYKFMDSERAVHYMLKYMTKGTDSLPEWSLDYQGRIRPYSASQGFWHDSKARKPSKSEGAKRPNYTLRQRFERCESAGVTGIRESVESNGVLNRRYAFNWRAPFDRIKHIAKAILSEFPEIDLDRVRSFFVPIEQIEQLRRAASKCGGPAQGRSPSGPPLRLGTLA